MKGPSTGGVLVVMAKAPRPGHVKTRLASAYPGDAIVDLYRALVEDTIDLGRSLPQTALAVVCPSPDVRALREWLPDDIDIVAQRGAGLADGLRSAFKAFCTADRRPVVAFNSDSPHLDPATLVSAFAALATHDVAIGPSDDGGYYLVGATEPHPALFDPPVLGTNSARDALVAEARRLGLSTWLGEERYDVDAPEDVTRIARDLAEHPDRAPRTASLLARWKSVSRA